jgi:hypothetical protein
MRPADSSRARAQAGYSLLELTVAAALASGFAIVLSSASIGYLGFLGDLRSRTDNLRSANTIRARMLADTKNASEAVCSDGSTLLLTADSGGGPTQVEYTASAGNLLRWYSVSNRTVEVADRVGSLSCSSLARGLEVDLEMGNEQQPFHLYLHLSEGPPPGGGGA